MSEAQSEARERLEKLASQFEAGSLTQHAADLRALLSEVAIPAEHVDVHLEAIDCYVSKMVRLNAYELSEYGSIYEENQAELERRVAARAALRKAAGR